VVANFVGGVVREAKDYRIKYDVSKGSEEQLRAVLIRADKYLYSSGASNLLGKKRRRKLIYHGNETGFNQEG